MTWPALEWSAEGGVVFVEIALADEWTVIPTDCKDGES